MGFVRWQGDLVALSFNTARLAGCLALTALSLTSVFSTGECKPDLLWTDVFQSKSVAQISMATTYFYTALLSVGSLAGGSWSRRFMSHNDFVLLTLFGVFAYRDVWPLATYTEVPVDGCEGRILWFKISILTFIAFVVPLFVPRQYVPIDHENPMEIPNPEQTASIFSLIFFGYLDPVIFEAYRVPHLSHTRLPPLADYDYAKHLTEKAFPHLDTLRGAKRRHLFFGILRTFPREFLGMSTIIVLQAVSNFASPIALNRILASFESDKPVDYIRPWFWVLCLFLARIAMSLCFQGYGFIGTIVVARTQAILTELIFEHSLRIRFKAEQCRETDSGHGKAKAGTKAALKREDNLVGKINTMVAVDVGNIVSAKDFLMVVIQGPLELIFAAVFLYKLLGWSAIVGFSSILLLLPIPGYMGGKIQAIHQSRMKKTDARVQLATETIGVLRMVKMFGWENITRDTLNVKREGELTWLWKDKAVSLKIGICSFIIPIFTMLVTYGTYTFVMGEALSASKVFSTMAVFEIVRGLLRRTSFLFNLSVKGKVSLDRVSQFLLETELLDSFSHDIDPVSTAGDSKIADGIGFNNAEFAWSKVTVSGTESPPSRSFRLRSDGLVAFKKGSINLIVGPTGSGKTSVLMALLGEMHFIPSGMDSAYNLPRAGGIAYAAQESWVQNATIKDNILFGSPYNEERYNKVIHQCALTHDLELFDAGDETEVSEKGLTLSGGQKARVTLARAVYSLAEIVLLDDILAALDVHTSKWIVNECLQGDLIRGRTVLLVTHNVALASPIANHIISVGLDGTIREVGSDITIALANDSVLANEIQHIEEAADLQKVVIDAPTREVPKINGKLIVAEEIAIGHVSGKAYKLFLNGLGANPVVFLALWMGGLALMHSGSMLAVWFLGYWCSQYEIQKPADVKASYYLSIYSLILFGSAILYSLAMLTYNYGTQRTSRKIHYQLVDSILRSTLRWLDETPASRILSRWTQDIASVDDSVTHSFGMVVDLAISMVVKLGGPVLLTPDLLLPGILIAGLGIYLGNVYLKAQMSCRREQSNGRSLVLAHFGAAFSGMVSIRAYGAQEAFKNESLKQIDHYTKVSRASYDLNRWIGIRIDLLGAVFTATLASYLLISNRLNAANSGFSLTMALEFCGVILWLVRFYNQFEVESNSLERIQSYLEIEHEPNATDAGKPPAAWPRSGELQVESLSARYSATGPDVLHDLSFHVKSGERVGIVGRTGSGKSSLTLSLLRCIITSGVVYFDGLSTSKINLEDLRSNITIIPQVPELLSGTLRRNLDPFEQNDDAGLNSALRSAGLFSLQIDGNENEAKLSLDGEIASGGGNLSVGQRQVIALARAIVRNSKLLILDEGVFTYNHQTDSVIQSSLRKELGSDVTVLTVAHRLQTVMDADKIMVLDDGRMVEFDTPKALLGKKGGHFKRLVDESGEKDTLYALAEKKSS
ncbi:hypothetical protein GALMADRAFT_57261 [Galerina marginata CBS 339.88]|uniref:P-loop containing nucleoside triphosphate hydrolase protein n=1 Tax=Galerina marginata (strain CBS 339.88) TaxID=685588 RepID=A0A067TL54_GALM3|nr:hypothetical protein GALMADRAFT_57261 [Galerina marginata CBS 339.88]